MQRIVFLLFLCIAQSSGFACSALEKLGLLMRLDHAFGPAYLTKVPGLSIDFDHKNIPILKPYLGSKHKNWYALSIPFPKEDLDPLYPNLAKVLNQDVILAGGSDLIEVALLRTGKVASPDEINLLMKKNIAGNSHRIDEMFQMVKISAPAFRGRAEMTDKDIQINGESGLNISKMIENKEKGKPLIGDFFPLAVPFKHGYAVSVKEDGSARLFFRTPKDLENYLSKTLTLPEEGNFEKDWHLKIKFKSYLLHCLKYHLNVYARAKPLGWHYSPLSKEILQSWGVELRKNPSETELLKKYYFDGASHQGVPLETSQEVWNEFGFE